MLKEVKKLFPILKWGKSYNKKFLRLDVIAGITVGAITIPEAIAYSSLAGLPPQAGLYAAFAALLVYFIFGTSNQLSIGPTSALSILVGSTIGTMTIVNPSNFWAIASFVGLLVGIFSIVAWILHMEFISRVISRSVLTGFSAGAAVYIMATQLSKLMGIDGATGGFFSRIAFIGTHLYEINIITLAIGILSVFYLLLSEKYLSKLPNALIIVAVPILLFTFIDLSWLGVSLVGNIPAGLPMFEIPKIPSIDLGLIVYLAGFCFILSYVEGMGTTKILGLKRDDDSADSNKELLALGLSNISSSIAQGFPVGGSFSRSAINEESGSQSPFSSLVSALIVIIVILFFTEFFSHLPETILAAIIIVAVTKIFNLKELKRYYIISKKEFVYAIVTAGGVLFLGILQGVVVGVVISVLGILYNIYNPHIVELGRVKGTRLYKDIRFHEPVETISNVLILRIDGAQVFLNSENIDNEILKRIKERKEISVLVLDMGNTDYLDMAGAENLELLHGILAKEGIELRLAHLNSPVRQLLWKMGLNKKLNMYKGIYPTIDDIVNNWEKKYYDEEEK
ncbi:DNA repair protein HhH-GPD [Methanobrevibacter arboriphilus]|uniref:DNA repair protein HhH-GPD n=1 Tax=Methanobrevibacter arboriphilus TaxID=39441 RepID=A0ACA8R1S1_METAZ|nr:SulP family inorganic anion transporter [Methanobrevibacter arboriphilus]BBL61464.1 DNA repair protein HhH-GPD [Methanobrevibacter arboriphilus]GLI11205.1 DNA repair protein HhH-GPD [Methanobrevibacter arboriphilus]